MQAPGVLACLDSLSGRRPRPTALAPVISDCPVTLLTAVTFGYA